MRFVDDEQRHKAFPHQTQKSFVLNPLRRHIEQFQTLQMEALNHFVPLLLGQARVKRGGGNLALSQALDLILHQRNERRNHQRQAGQQRRRELIAERFPLAGRHDRHGVAAGQYRPHDLELAWPELRQAELFLELSSEIVHRKR